MSLRAQRSHLLPGNGRRGGLVTLLAVATVLVGSPSALAAKAQDCVRAEAVLWGDGKHDDTSALNAWLRGEDAIWASSGSPVGPTISSRSFRLSSAIYVRAGSGRALHDFRLEWPERGEVVSGGTILAGADPDQEPVVSGVSIVGGDPGEGKPFEASDHAVPDPRSEASCATS